MAKKKTQKKEKEESTFDMVEYVQEMEIPVWIKTGFLYHTEVKKLNLKSEKELMKEFDKFMKGVE